MNCWRLREVCEPGKDGRLFKLSKNEPLTVGKSSDCTLQLDLQTITNKHAVVEWNDKKRSYIIRDLGPSNTLINYAPLTKGTEELRHGDNLRFGYDKTRVFRVEECYESTVKAAAASSTSLHLTPTSTATQTSPKESTTIPQPSLPGTTMGVHSQPTVTTQFVSAGPIQQGGVFSPAGGQVGYYTPGGQQGTIYSPGGQQGMVLTPGAPGGQQGTIYSPGGQQVLTPGGQQGMVLTPGGQQGMVLTPGGQQGVVLTPGGQQGVVLTPGGQYVMPQAQGFPYTYTMAQPGYPTHPSTPPPTLVYHQPPSHAPLPVQQQQATPTSSLQVQDIESETVVSEIPSSPKRTDGRRQIELGHSPNLASTSKLYGQPSWWGEGEGEGDKDSSDSEFRHIQPGTQILRDIEYDPRRGDQDDASSVVSSTSSRSRLSVKDELRLKAICNSVAQDQTDPSSTSAWVVDFGSGSERTPKSKAPRFQSKQRPRSADPSPVRVSSRRDTSPASVENRRISSASTRREGTIPNRKLQATFVKRKETEPRVKQSTNKTVTKRPSSSVTVSRSATVLNRRSVPSAPRAPRARRSSFDAKLPKNSTKSSGLDSKKSGSSSDLSSKSLPKIGSVSDKTYTKIEGQGSSDELLTSMSDLSLTSLADPVIVGDKTGLKSASEPRVGGDGGGVSGDGGGGGGGGVSVSGEDGKPGSARKQWTNDQSQTQTPDSLMFASIEARMRRLSKLAQGAAVQLSSIKRGLQDMGVVSKDSDTNLFKPFSPATDQHIPEWKFFNKEVDSTFRSIRSVERWLNDIDSTVSSMQLLSRGGGAKEEVDYETTESEADYYQDSIEDNFASCSDNYTSD